jgi:hypothetical protein
MSRRVVSIEADAYQSRLAEWSSTASVRATAIRRLDDGDDGLPFSPELVPCVSHELVRKRDHAAQMILSQKLHSYFRFTSHLELKAVLPSCMMIAFKETPIVTSDEFAHDGFKIAVDEAHHAYCAEDMKKQLIEITGVRPHRERPPVFLHRLQIRQDSLHGRFRQLALLVFSCVSETLITSSLTTVPSDARVLQAIRDVIMDHACDEARHHRYFSHFMHQLWAQLSADEKDIVGPLFAEFIEVFLSRDAVTELDWLEAAGFSNLEAKRIVDESYEAADVRQMYRKASKPTIMLMEKFGMLDHPATADALASAGII